MTLGKVKLLLDKIDLSEKEMTDWEVRTIVTEDGRASIQWKKDAKTEKEIDISDLLAEQIALALKKLNDENKLQLSHLSLYERFVEKKDTETKIETKEEK